MAEAFECFHFAFEMTKLPFFRFFLGIQFYCELFFWLPRLSAQLYSKQISKTGRLLAEVAFRKGFFDFVERIYHGTGFVFNYNYSNSYGVLFSLHL